MSNALSPLYLSDNCCKGIQNKKIYHSVGVHRRVPLEITNYGMNHFLEFPYQKQFTVF